MNHLLCAGLAIFCIVGFIYWAADLSSEVYAQAGDEEYDDDGGDYLL